jgi:hypothetical protein
VIVLTLGALCASRLSGGGQRIWPDFERYKRRSDCPCSDPKQASRDTCTSDMLFWLPSLLILASFAMARSVPRMSQHLFARFHRPTDPLSGSTSTSCENKTVIQEEILESGIKVTQLLCGDPRSDDGLEKRDAPDGSSYCEIVGTRDQSDIYRHT